MLEKPEIYQPTISKNFEDKVLGFNKWIMDNYNKYHKKST